MLEAICLATVIYLEARGETFKGQQAIGHVVFNRAKKLNKPICVVAKQPKQFAYYNLLWKQRQTTQYTQAYTIATNILGSKSINPIGRSTFFHADYVNPYWAKNKIIYRKIGKHVFYSR